MITLAGTLNSILMYLNRRNTLFLLILNLPSFVFGDDYSLPVENPITIYITQANAASEYGEKDLVGVASTASQGIIDQQQFQTRPLLRPGELLEVVPGMVVTQHSGDGKANQYFLRGFNLDHGTDFATFVDDMPVNMRTHAHGQGYTDLNFIIPELVQSVDYKKGVYYAEEGDFSSAGAAHFNLAKNLEKGIAQVTAGEFNYRRSVLAKSFKLGKGDLLFGSELFFYDGPWDRPNDVNKFNGTLRYSVTDGNSEFSILALAYDNRWNSSDQIPQRAIDQDIIGRYGNLDNTLGGTSSRYSLSTNWKRFSETSRQNLSVYALAYDLDLYSNFTYFLDNSDKGDQFEQFDKRVVYGITGETLHNIDYLSNSETLALGFQERSDIIQKVGLYNTAQRERFNTVRSDSVKEHSLGLYLRHENKFLPKLRTVSGLRDDIYFFDTDSINSANSGNEIASILSPKLNLILGPWDKSEFYLSGGFGFHSNDARGVSTRIDPKTNEAVLPVDPLVRTKGAELGLRSSIISGMKNTLSFWLLDSDSELVFIGDAGTTEPSSGSRRQGIEYATNIKPISELSFDFNFSLSKARLSESDGVGTRIPGALEQVVTSGINFDSSGFSKDADSLFASLRFRQFSPYSLIEDNSVRASQSTMVNGRLGYRIDDFWVSLDVFNLLNSKDSDIQYYYPSRLNNEPAAGVDDVHIHPFEPQQIRITIGYRL